MANLATAVGQTLAAGGIRHAFGVVGNGNIYAVDALVDSGVEYVAARHEGGAITMADAYYRSTGDVAVCTTTYGPGLTNVATGLAEAAKHGSGVLVLCGDRPALRPARPADIDQSAFVATLGAVPVRVTDPNRARATAAQALRMARSERRPVVLNLPDDLLTTEVADLAVPAAAECAAHPAPSPAALTSVLDAIAAARRPLVLAGLGAWHSGAGRIIEGLADHIGAILTTTVMGNGLFAGNPWSAGICGGFAAPRAREIISSADLVLAFGTSLSTFTQHGGHLFDPRATVIRVDQLGVRPVPRVDVEVAGDAAAVASALLDGARGRALRGSAWRAEVAGLLARTGWEYEPYDDLSTDELIDPRTLSRALARLLPADRTLVTDGGHFVGWPFMYWSVPDPSATVFTGAAFMSIGLGFAGAVGAAVGRPERTTVVALGDGGAAMGLPELATLVRTARSALVVVYDDSAYGWEVHVYGDKVRHLHPLRCGDSDFAAIGSAMGAESVTVRSAGDIDAVRSWLQRGAAGTLLLDCKVVPGVVGPFLTDLRAQLTAGASPPAPETSGRMAA